MALSSGFPAPEQPWGAAASGCPSLLLVDDDDGVRCLLREFLGQCGYRVAAAADGAEALAVASSLDVGLDLLITDVKMPGMTGIELARRFAVERPGVPVLFLSGETDCLFRIRAASIDAQTEVLTKPLNLRLLQSYVEAAIQSRNAAERP